MLAYNKREMLMADSKTGKMRHSAYGNNSGVVDDAVVKGQRCFSQSAIPTTSDIRELETCASDEKSIDNSPEKPKDFGPKHFGEQKNRNEYTGPNLAGMKRLSSEEKMNGYDCKKDIPMGRIENIKGPTITLNVKPHSSEVNIKYSWQRDERVGSNIIDGEQSHDAADAPNCSSERTVNESLWSHQNKLKRNLGSYDAQPYVVERARERLSEKNSNVRRTHKNVESRNQRNHRDASNDDTIAVEPSSPSVLVKTERELLAEYSSHSRYPGSVVSCLSQLEREMQPQGVAQDVNKYRGLGPTYYECGSKENIYKDATVELAQGKNYEKAVEDHKDHGAINSGINEDPLYPANVVVEERIDETKEEAGRLFFPSVIADPIAAVYNFFKF